MPRHPRFVFHFTPSLASWAQRGQTVAKGRKGGAFRIVEDLSLIADTIQNNVFFTKSPDMAGSDEGSKC